MHCCGAAPADDEETDPPSKFDPCTSCGNDANGSCYSALALVDYEWNITSSGSNSSGWQGVYNKDEKAELLGPPSTFSPASFSRHNQTTTGNNKNVYKYRLLWRALNGTTADDNPGTWQTSNSETPPAGLVAAGEGADPGLFDVDSATGTISALPRRNGNFSMYLLVVDTAGAAASSFGLPKELDQVVVKRWDFTVVDKEEEVPVIAIALAAAVVAAIAMVAAPAAAIATPFVCSYVSAIPKGPCIKAVLRKLGLLWCFEIEYPTEEDPENRRVDVNTVCYRKSVETCAWNATLWGCFTIDGPTATSASDTVDPQAALFDLNTVLWRCLGCPGQENCCGKWCVIHGPNPDPNNANIIVDPGAACCQNCFGSGNVDASNASAKKKNDPFISDAPGTAGEDAGVLYLRYFEYVNRTRNVQI